MECDETFNVTISSVTTCGVTIGNIDNANVTIGDDDGKCIHEDIILLFNQLPTGGIVSLNQSQYLVTESDNVLTMTLTMKRRCSLNDDLLYAVGSEDVTVEVTISDGSASGNVH